MRNRLCLRLTNHVCPVPHTRACYALLPQWVRSSPSGLVSTVAACYALLPQWACSSPSSGLAPRPHRRPLRQDCPRGVQCWTLWGGVHQERLSVFMLHLYGYRVGLLLRVLAIQWRLVRFSEEADVLLRHPQPHAAHAPSAYPRPSHPRPSHPLTAHPLTAHPLSASTAVPSVPSVAIASAALAAALAAAARAATPISTTHAARPSLSSTQPSVPTGLGRGLQRRRHHLPLQRARPVGGGRDRASPFAPATLRPPPATRGGGGGGGDVETGGSHDAGGGLAAPHVSGVGMGRCCRRSHERPPPAVASLLLAAGLRLLLAAGVPHRRRLVL